MTGVPEQEVRQISCTTAHPDSSGGMDFREVPFASTDGCANGSERAAALLPAAPAQMSKELLNRLHLNLLPVLWLGYFFSAIDKANIAYAELRMQGDLGLQKSDYGLAAGIFFASYAIVQIPSNHVVTIVGARKVLGFAMVAWGACAAMTALVENTFALCLVRFLLGFFEAGYYPGVLLYLSQWYPDVALGQAMSIVMTSAACGSMIGSASSGALMQWMDGAARLAGWQWLFVVQGSPSIILGVIALIILPDSMSSARWLGDDDRTLLSSLMQDKPRGSDSFSLVEAFAETCQRFYSWFFAGNYFLLAMLSYLTSFFLPLQLKEAFPEMPLWQIGLFGSLQSASLIIIMPIVATWTDRGKQRNQRRFFIMIGCPCVAAVMLAVAGICMLKTTHASEVARMVLLVFMVVLSMLGFAIRNSALAPIWALHSAKQDPRLKAVSIGFVNSVGNLGGLVGPYAMGILHDTIHTACPPDQPTDQNCIAKYGWGTIIFALIAFFAICISACVAKSRGVTS